MTLFPNFLHQVWFTSFNVDYAINPITENLFNDACTYNIAIKLFLHQGGWYSD